MTQKKIFHKAFLELIENLAVGQGVTSSDLRILKAEARWLKTYLEGKRRASASRRNFGRPALPDDQVKLASLKKRAYRERKASSIL